MESPWNIEEAFEPMFDEAVEITLPDRRFTIKACVFPVEQVDPFVEEDYDNKVKLVNILIRKRCYPDSLKPGVGDKVSLEDGTQYKICEVRTEQTWFIATARSV